MNIVGRKFGEMTVTSLAGSDGKNSLWNVICNCGNTTVKLGKELTRRGGRRFCGRSCPLNKKALRNATHKMSLHPAYAVWRSMKSRCLRKTHSAYKNYGGRGISVCQEWLESFESFWSDMHESYLAGLDLDRIDNESGYSKTNCRWVTRSRNTRNKRNGWKNRSDIPEDFLEMAQARGIKRTTLYYRLNKGLSWEQTLNTPVDPKNQFTTS
jgi:hypothetical protein